MYRILLFLLVAFLPACKQSSVPPSPDNSPFRAQRFSVSKDIPYGPLPGQVLDVYTQGSWIGEPDYWKPDTSIHPVLVYIHGGGWCGGSKETVTPFFLPYMEKGWNIVNIEYRRGEGTAPQAVDDCMLALRWIAENASNYQIDTDRVYLSGESAGGHLALLTGFLNTLPGSHPCFCGDKLQIKAVINWFGITDIRKVETYLRNEKPEWNYAASWLNKVNDRELIMDDYSPVNRLSAHSPPVISIHGMKDEVVPPSQALALHHRLDSLKVKNELLLIPDGKHLGFSQEEFIEIYQRIFDFVE
ncbi:MAG: alpha/beta hydrolase fold domain-containing protein [Bacteroidota bacterium]